MYLAFDLETAQLADGANYDLGITCAAMVQVDDAGNIGEPRCWQGAETELGDYAPTMTSAEASAMLDELLYWQARGGQVVTWNGTSFDWRVLAATLAGEPAAVGRVKRLALSHIDPAFTMFCHKGFMIGLTTAAAGLGVAGKLDGMTGVEAVTAWQEGRERQELVLRYVGQDCVALALVYRAALKLQGFDWQAKSGRFNSWRCATLALTVAEALRVPEPDTSWMHEPRTRAELVGWALGALPVSPASTVPQYAQPSLWGGAA